MFVNGFYVRKTGRSLVVEDGTSNTVMFSEVAIGVNQKNVKGGLGLITVKINDKPNLCLNNVVSKEHTTVHATNNYLGTQWCFSYPVHTLFVTILPPNSASCAQDIAFGWGPTVASNNGGGLITASSYHSGGVNCAMADGAVRFVSETIDSGDPAVALDPAQSGNSVRGVWGALGTTNGKESTAAL